MRRASAAWGVGLIAFALVTLVAMVVLRSTGLWGVPVGDYSWGPGCRLSSLGDGGSRAQVVEQQFLERMIPHHEEAIAMAQVAVAGARRQEVRQLAQDIITTQVEEVAKMESWYREWFDGASGTLRRNFDRESSGMGRHWRLCRPAMHGKWWSAGPRLEFRGGTLATAEDLDREFLRRMVPHHHMGVMMARMALAYAERPEIRELAQQIIDTQWGEIQQMGRWYREWYR